MPHSKLLVKVENIYFLKLFSSLAGDLVDFNIILTILFKKSFSGNVPAPGSGTYNNYLSDQPALSSGDKKEYAITRNKGNLGKL